MGGRAESRVRGGTIVALQYLHARTQRVGECAGRSELEGASRVPLTWIPRFLCQNWQSAAPPAMVPRRYGLISMTFLTVCEAAKRTREVRIPTNKGKRNMSAGVSYKEDGDIEGGRAHRCTAPC